VQKQSKKIKQVRRLKIYPKVIARSWHKQITVPEIRLCGVWLSEIHFKPGEHIIVTYQKNKIVITAEVEKK